jgi:hypothetical protein
VSRAATIPDFIAWLGVASAMACVYWARSGATSRSSLLKFALRSGTGGAA